MQEAGAKGQEQQIPHQSTSRVGDDIRDVGCAICRQKRLQQLENICASYDGVEKCYALQAGREVRVMVVPEKVNDEKMVLIARQIAKQIENEMNYPGQVKINLIRESRVVDYAK